MHVMTEHILMGRKPDALPAHRVIMQLQGVKDKENLRQIVVSLASTNERQIYLTSKLSLLKIRQIERSKFTNKTKRIVDFFQDVRLASGSQTPIVKSVERTSTLRAGTRPVAIAPTTRILSLGPHHEMSAVSFCVQLL